MVERKEDTLVKEERWPKVIPIAVPPPIFLQRLTVVFVSCFLCFSTASFWERQGTLYIVGFMLRRREPQENG
jgi:hypothetical protein